MTSTTPLLLLLDSILSQEPDRIRDARTRVRSIIAKSSPSPPLAVASSTITTTTTPAASAPTPSSAAAAAAAAAAADVENEDSGSNNNHNYNHNNNKGGLLQDVDMLLMAFPNLASVASSHDGSLPLHFAASIGNVQVAERILNSYPEAASTPNTKGKIPLMYAAREGRKDMVAFFLYATPHTARIASKKQKLALHFAAGDGHVDVVRQLLRVHPEGASMPSAKGKLPLHFASRWGHIEIAFDLLYFYPQGVRCVDWDGSLPLHDAAREGQVTMSKFLIERYPFGLSVANIRGEIPLFPAVRTGNKELVILYLQGWTMGGMHILKAVSADDNIQGWDWDIVELCLRGAVDNFAGCALLEGKEPPAVCCPVEREECLHGLDPKFSTKSRKSSAPRVMDACCRWREQIEASTFSGHPSYHPCPSISSTCKAASRILLPLSREAELPITVCNSAGSCCGAPKPLPPSAAPELIPRSKSPILEDGGSRAKKRLSNASANDRKRFKKGFWYEGDDIHTSQAERPRMFIALHAALACGASSHVIKCVLKKHPNQVYEVDERRRSPLHFAIYHPACSTAVRTSLDDDKERQVIDDNNRNEFVKIVIEDILKPNPEAAFASDDRGRLPLHLAITAKTDFRIIQALVETNPSSGVDPIESGDARFLNKPPIYMATEYNCDLSTTFLLLRGDPSVVSSVGKPLKAAGCCNS